MRRLPTILTFLVLTINLNAYLDFPDSKGLSYGNTNVLNYNTDLTTFFSQVDYLPIDLPNPYIGTTGKGYHHKGFGKSDPFDSCTRLCSDRYDPVCGQNYQSYFNLCHALCDGTRLKYIGKCKFDGFEYSNCSKCRKSTGNPVCGTDSVSYPNKCFATCSGVNVAEYQCCCGDDTCCIYDIIDFLYRVK